MTPFLHARSQTVNEPWHAGERALQQRAGSRDTLADVGQRVLRDHMPEQHRGFFALLPFLLAGSVDDAGQPWASVLAGPPGFAHAPTAQSLRIDALPAQDDPLHAALVPGAPLGLLGIQPHTRRRNRLNGWVAEVDAAGFSVTVGQSFGNCPRYIHPREAVHAPSTAPARSTVLSHLDADASRLIAQADTFFLASAHPDARASHDPAAGVDVSHRGGPPGFVQVRGDAELVVPDYAGNQFFNTLGNLALEPRCGLLFLDGASGDRLHVAAQAQVQWSGPEVAAVPGAQRLLRLQVTSARWLRGGLPLAWQPLAEH